ncbi:DUF427 domain-containing protein [Halovulum sp. GXIMD14794]
MTALPVENVQGYPRPPTLEQVPQRLRVFLGGGLVAETIHAYRVLETHHAPTYYLPPGDVHATLTSAPGRSICEWKGTAEYLDVTLNGVAAPRAAWSYVRPTAGYASLAGHIAFYAALMDDCFVGDTRVTPQPGDFYGGWVTENLRGRIKGAAGTEHW